MIRTRDPHGLASSLRERGISSGRHYPAPVHLSGAYRHLGHVEGAFPVAETLARECLSLPIFPGMREAEIESVISAVTDHFTGA